MRGASPLWSLLLAVVVSATLVSRLAQADEPEMSASVDSQRLGVGEVLRLTLHVASSQYQPAHPQPGNTTGFSVVGSSSGPTQQVMIANGRMTSQRGLDVSWSLRAEKVGTWYVGPVQVQVGGSTYKAGPVRVVVLPSGQGPPRAPDPFDPFGGGAAFDPFKNLFDSLNGGAQAPPSYGTDPKLALDAPLGAIAFLHATADVTQAVVGQQVTVTMYLYQEVSTRDPGLVDVHEATAADFVKRPLFEDDNGDRNISHAMVGGHMYAVRLLRKWALFPIRTGDLTVSPMELTLQRSRATGDPSRQSEVLTIHVTEPPMEHRPPGYTLGDVGKFALTAEVLPRDVEQDSAIGVTLNLSGTGNLPAMITPPAQAGIEWLPPEVHEKVGVMAGDQFGGTRTFSYVVRVHRPGDVRLGGVRIPYWDPAAKRYDVARADLGTVTVRPSTAPKVTVDQPPDPFAALPDVRGTMGGTRASASHRAEDHPMLFWVALGVTPLGFLVFSGISRVARTARDRLAERRASPETDLRTKLSAAERAAKAADARAILAATARAIHAATVAYPEVIVRDARGGEAARRLLDAGVEEDVAKEVDALLSDCEAARFSPDEPALAVARERWAHAKKAIDALRRGA